MGFLLNYAIAANPRAVWPAVPGLTLIGFGAFVQAITFGVSYAQFWWLATTGHSVSSRSVHGSSSAAVSSAGTGYPRGPFAIPMAWPMAHVGNPPLQDTITLSTPTDGVSSLVDQAPQVRLVPRGDVLLVDSSTCNKTYVDYVIDAPAALGADIRSASGSVTVSGLAGPVHITTASGAVDARDLQGATFLETASGGIRMNNISGAGIHQVVAADSTSGGIDLAGDFVSPAQIDSTSGAVSLAFASDAAMQCERRCARHWRCAHRTDHRSTQPHW